MEKSYQITVRGDLYEKILAAPFVGHKHRYRCDAWGKKVLVRSSSCKLVYHLKVSMNAYSPTFSLLSVPGMPLLSANVLLLKTRDGALNQSQKVAVNQEEALSFAKE